MLITGDRREDLLAALRFMRAEGADLIITSGGLGPDRRRHDGRDRGRLRRPAAAARRGPRAADRRDHRALRAPLEPRPEGARVRQPQAGDGPGGRRRARPGRNGARASWCRPTARSWSCCRARRASCRRAGARRSRPSRSRQVVAGAPRYRQTMVRMFGVPESEIAETLRVADARDRPRRARDHDLPAPRASSRS